MAGQRRDRLGDREIVRVQEPDPGHGYGARFHRREARGRTLLGFSRSAGHGYVRIARTLGKEALKQD